MKSLAAMLKYSVLTNQSAKRINSLKESNKYKSLDRVWFIKLDLGLLAKIHNKSTDEEWAEYLKLLKQCKVTEIMLSYVTQEFPGREGEFRAIGVIEEEDNGEVDLLNDGNDAAIFADFI